MTPVRSGVARRWRGMAVALAVAVCAPIAVGTVAVPAVAQSAAERAPQAVKDVLSDKRFQQKMPSGDVDFENGDESPQIDFGPLPKIPEAVRAVGRVLVWAVAAAVLLVVLFYLANELPRLRRARLAKAKEPAEAAADWSEDAAPPTEWQADLEVADGLAREGRYVEAIHVLLLHGLRELRARIGGGMAPSLTSREVLRRVPMPDAARDALTSIVRAVELGHFGGRALDADDYDRCRGHYLTFAQDGGLAAGQGT